MKMPSISLAKEALSNFEDAIQKEWITTNGLGGYASSTVLGINTRKYHGLLVAALHPPGDRRVCLAKMDEEVAVRNNIYPLGANEFQNGIFPRGYESLKEFSLSPFPKHVFISQSVEVQKTIFMPREKNAVTVLYKILNMSGADVTLRVFPMVTWRHFHSVIDRWKIPAEPAQKAEPNQVCVSFGATKPALIMGAIGGRYFPRGKWIESLYYREEAKRGESCLDDCYQSGSFEFEVKANRNESFALSTVVDESEDVARKIMAELPVTLYDMAALYEREKSRQEDYLTKFYGIHVGVPISDWLSALVFATDAFVVKSGGVMNRSVIAGYHWFEEWGRDTFVSLSGLMLVTGRLETARRVFLGYAKLCKEGLVPSFVLDSSGQVVYSSVDATLWFLNAVLQYLKYTGDFKFIQEQLWQTLEPIIDSYAKGTLFNIHVDADGLLSHGGRLTWMDATVDDQPITPRAGKAVEVQALWYNSLKIMELLADKFQEKGEGERYTSLADRARRSFVERFWSEEKSCLCDVVTNGEQDLSLRPNQIMAVALDFSMLDSVKKEKVVDSVQHELLTPFGLRTLAKSDSRYMGVYSGDRRSRDRAYHNGTVWPWLLGPFTTAFLKVKSYSEFRRDYAMKNFLSPLFSKQVFEAGLGTIGEIFDGDFPHAPKGCIAQAWSVAEPLRAYVEDVLQIRPRYEKDVLQGLR